ncbi:hypothetical protein GGI35DRAFT_288800 [Trichoderma velutinum]
MRLAKATCSSSCGLQGAGLTAWNLTRRSSRRWAIGGEINGKGVSGLEDRGYLKTTPAHIFCFRQGVLKTTTSVTSFFFDRGYLKTTIAPIRIEGSILSLVLDMGYLKTTPAPHLFFSTWGTSRRQLAFLTDHSESIEIADFRLNRCCSQRPGSSVSALQAARGAFSSAPELPGGLLFPFFYFYFILFYFILFYFILFYFIQFILSFWATVCVFTCQWYLVSLCSSVATVDQSLGSSYRYTWDHPINITWK